MNAVSFSSFGRMGRLYAACLSVILTACPSPVSSETTEGQPQRDYFCEDVGKPFFSPSKERPGIYVPNRHQAMASEFKMPKPPGTKRVFVVGESVAAILGHPEKMGRMERAKRGTDIEIINCGMGGYESYRIEKVLSEVIAYAPDLIVVLSGNNEYGERCHGPLFELRRRETRLLQRYYAYKEGEGAAGKLASLKMHGKMLKKMGAKAAAAGIPVVFCTLPANLEDMPPGGPPPMETPGFAQGYAWFYSGLYDKAAGAFKGMSGKNAFAAFYLAGSLKKSGHTREAAPLFRAALAMDPALSRTDDDRNALIRESAAAEGACVADLEALFSRISRGLPGFAQFTDGVHWRPGYNKLVWAEIFRSATACGIKGFEGYTPRKDDWERENSYEDGRKRLSYLVSWMREEDLNERSLAEMGFLRRSAPGLLKKASTSADVMDELLISNFWTQGMEREPGKVFPLFLMHLAETERRAGHLRAALDLCDKVSGLKRATPELTLLRAQILAAMGRKAEAKEAFELSISTPPTGMRGKALAAAWGIVTEAHAPAVRPSREARTASKELSDKAAKELKAGNTAAARDLLAESLKKNEANPEALIDLCMIDSAVGNTESALRNCSAAAEAVYASADYDLDEMHVLACEASLQAYRLGAKLGRPEASAGIIKECLKKAPPGWGGTSEARRALAAAKK